MDGRDSVRPGPPSVRWGVYDPDSGRRERNQLCTLTIWQFLERLLWHVPPPNFQTVRPYGLYTSAKQSAYTQLLSILPESPQSALERPPTSGDDRADNGWLPLDDYLDQRSRCPVCGKKLVLSQLIPSSVSGKIAPRDQQPLHALKRARRRGSE